MFRSHGVATTNGPVTNGIMTPLAETTAVSDFTSNGNHFHDVHYSTSEPQHQNGNFTKDEQEIVESRLEEDESKESIEENKDKRNTEEQSDNDNSIKESEGLSTDSNTDDCTSKQVPSEDELKTTELVEADNDKTTDKEEEETCCEQKEIDSKEDTSEKGNKRFYYYLKCFIQP